MKRVIILIVASVFVLGLISWYGYSGSLDSVRPTRGEAVKAVYASGTVESTYMMPISSKFGSRLIELNVDEGDRVLKDQQLARLESPDLEYTIQDLKAKEAFAKVEYERDVTLYNKKVIAKEELDKTSAAYDSAKASRLAAESQNNYNILYAPSDGMIIKRDGEIGQFIPANQALFWFSGDGDLRITADVDEEDIVEVKVGQSVLVQSDGFPGQVFNGIVDSITQKGDPVARTFRVRISFDKNVPFMIGMNVETNIIVSESNNALLIPTDALNGDYVWTISDGIVKKVKIKVGAKNLDKTEVIDGLDDSSIVVRGGVKLTEGQKARPRIK